MKELAEAMEQLADELTDRGNERRNYASKNYSMRTDAYKKSFASGAAYISAAMEIRATVRKIRGY